DLGGLMPGVATALTLRPFDAAGNPGPTFSGTVTRGPGGSVGAPRLDGLEMTPPSGALTNNPAVRIAGRVAGERPPFRVDFLVDGFVERQLTGLGPAQPFAHTMALPGDGTHQLTVRTFDAAGASGTTVAGAITLDRVPPGPPVIVEPPPGRPVFTNADRLAIRGFLAETPSAGRAPSIHLRGPAGVRFEPAQPQEVRDLQGHFSTTVVLAGLPDGDYPIRVTVRDAAGNEDLVQSVTLSLAAGKLEARVSRQAEPRAVLRALRAHQERRRWLFRLGQAAE
ncbi:MAG: hypothetical protein HY814_07765, partial [Candidatus Riflebacteria bacterium]|nr:hypothetical protein [Candidatus Riflebacteria bacterium]